jgi:hypothetical protein
VDSVGIAVGAELFQFQAGGGITTVFGCGIAGDTRGTLVSVSAALGAFQRNHNTDTFVFGHGFAVKWRD